MNRIRTLFLSLQPFPVSSFPCWLAGHRVASAGARRRDVAAPDWAGWRVVCELFLVWRCSRCGRTWQVCTDLWTERERVA